jgi:hypothetical protein
MIVRESLQPAWPRIALALTLFALGLSMCGCAEMSDNMTVAFADPSKYDLYDCKQLEDERKQLGTRTTELQGLISKAETGTGGTVVAELAYRNDYVALRGQSHYVEEAWRKRRCRASAPAPAGKPDNPSVPSANAVPAQPSKSGGAVY